MKTGHVSLLAATTKPAPAQDMDRLYLVWFCLACIAVMAVALNAAIYLAFGLVPLLCSIACWAGWLAWAGVSELKAQTRKDRRQKVGAS